MDARDDADASNTTAAVRSTLILLRHAEPVIPTPGGPDDDTRPLTT
ncbi:hypothetical protein [Nocardia neocaledoniensis]|nr:hypothetical protein [Nocardia neocaledoniensis]